MLTVAALFIYAACAQKLPGNWPPAMQIAPANPDWTSKVLSGVQIPDLPVTTAGNPVWDTSAEITSCKGNPNYWALTYDDGPAYASQYCLCLLTTIHSEFTDGVLADLSTRNITATFFVTGQQVVLFPRQLKKAFDQGHEIGLHSWCHRHSTTLTNDQLIAEFIWTAKAVYQIIGKVPHYVRPPFGDMDARTKAIFNALGLVSVIWNRDSADAGLRKDKIPSVTKQALQWTKEPNPDGILSLQHDVFQYSAQAIGPVLDVVKKSSFKPVLMSECGSNQNIGPVYLTSGRFYDLVTKPVGSNVESSAHSIVSTSSIVGSFALQAVFTLFTLLSFSTVL